MKIKGCRNCPFVNHDLEYGSNCGISEGKMLISDFREELLEKVKWDFEGDPYYGHFAEECKDYPDTPEWCPLRKEAYTVELEKSE